MRAAVARHAERAFAGQAVERISMRAVRRAGRALAQKVYAIKDGAPLDRKLRVAVIGGGPAGACTAETLAKGGVETFLIERKLDNCKVGVEAIGDPRSSLAPTTHARGGIRSAEHAIAIMLLVERGPVGSRGARGLCPPWPSQLPPMHWS